MNTSINKEQQKTLPPLSKGLSTYKIVVPVNVEEKIRYLIRKFPHTEWSGVLFYSHAGSFEGSDLVITCQDIFPMDLGSSGWTEFRMSEDVTAYMAQNIELFDCEMGLIHSHHSLGAFFSGQDNTMLQQEGADTNCFVSLIVDTKGTYVARITRKVQTKSEVTIRSLGKSYEFFGNGSVPLDNGSTETVKVVDKEIIEYFDLDVERHAIDNSLEYLDTRFDEILKKKNTNNPNNKFWQNSFWDRPDDKFIIPESKPGKKGSDFDADLFSRNNPDIMLTGDDNKILDSISGFSWTPDPKLIHRAVVNIITCNLILNPDKFDLRQWINRHMTKVYKNIFGGDSIYAADVSASGAFTEWKDFILQFTLDYFDYSSASDSVLEVFEWAQGRVAEAICEELLPYIGSNAYIRAYYDDLQAYINIE